MSLAGHLVLPLRDSLIAVPAAGQMGVCDICHSSSLRGYPTCHRCSAARGMDPPEVLPITLSVHGELMHEHLRAYKDSPSHSVQARMSVRLAALLAVFIAHHERCIGQWDYVTCVPSPRRVALAPVVTRVHALHGRYRQVLAMEKGNCERELDRERLRLTAGVQGDRVLLLDDTFTTGASLFSASAALRHAGAEVVGPVVIGRHVQRSWEPSRELLSWLEKRRWDVGRCARCAGEQRDNASRSHQVPSS